MKLKNKLVPTHPSKYLCRIFSPILAGNTTEVRLSAGVKKIALGEDQELPDLKPDHFQQQEPSPIIAKKKIPKPCIFWHLLSKNQKFPKPRVSTTSPARWLGYESPTWSSHPSFQAPAQPRRLLFASYPGLQRCRTHLKIRNNRYSKKRSNRSL